MSKRSVIEIEVQPRVKYGKAPLTVWFDGEPVVKLRNGAGSRWIGTVRDMVVKIDGGGWGASFNQARHEWKVWDRLIRTGGPIEAFAPLLWFAEVKVDCTTFGVSVQRRIPGDTLRSPQEYSHEAIQARQIAKMVGLQDWFPGQAKLCPTAPYGFLIHDYGL